MSYTDPVNADIQVNFSDRTCSPLQEEAIETTTSKAKNNCKATRRKALADSSIAALPPQYQEQRERDAVQNDAELKKILNNEEITDICKVNGGYMVYTQNEQVMVYVHYLPQSMPGPAHFALSFGDVESRQS